MFACDVSTRIARNRHHQNPVDNRVGVVSGAKRFMIVLRTDGVRPSVTTRRTVPCTILNPLGSEEDRVVERSARLAPEPFSLFQTAPRSWRTAPLPVPAS